MLTRWGDYSTVQLALAIADRKALEEAAKDAEARALVRGWGERTKTMKQDEERARKRLDAGEANQQFLDAYALEKLLEGVTSALEDDAFAVSRELTRRLGREPRDRRERRWGAA